MGVITRERNGKDARFVQRYRDWSNNSSSTFDHRETKQACFPWYIPTTNALFMSFLLKRWSLTDNPGYY